MFITKYLKNKLGIILNDVYTGWPIFNKFFQNKIYYYANLLCVNYIKIYEYFFH